MQVTITDKMTHETATIPSHDIVETITPWFPAPTPEITEAIAKLQDAVEAGSHDSHGLAEFLALKLEEVPRA